MEQKDKELLLKDLSARLYYGVMIHIEETNEREELYCLNIPQEGLYTRNKEHHNISSLCPIEQAKPYLRSLSSITEEELEEWNRLFVDPSGYVQIDILSDDVSGMFDWLNAHHFDYRGLIEKNLALEAPKGMYNIKEK